MNLKRSTVERYARGSAPFAAIPLLGVGALVFLRAHLRAALESEPSTIIYNSDTKVVTFRNHRSEWKLNDLLGQGKIQQWQLREQLFAWALGKRSGARKRKESAALGKAGVYVRKLNEAIVKLTKQRDKIYLHAPKNPVMYKPGRDAGNYGRDSAKLWADEKPLRKAIAKVAGKKMLHGEPKTWADFYRDVEAVSGRHVHESETYSRVHGRKRYRHGLPDHPDREDYLKNLPRYLCLSEKSYDSRPYDPFKKDTYGEQLNAFDQHHRARQEYCDALRQRQAIESQIAQHLVEIKTITEQSNA